MRNIKKSTVLTSCIIAALVALLVLSALFGGGNYAVTSFVFIILMLVPFFFSFEKRRPQARELVPIAVLAAIASLGRVAFAPFQFVKPTSAVVIITGIAFGPQAGFITGAVAALTSNIFFGQGPFTPWQMFSWGIMGFCAGAAAKHGLLRGRSSICIFGFVWGFFFGWIMDLWQVLGYVNPITPKSFLLTYMASAVYDLIHAVSNAVFLFLIAKPWIKILDRVKTKYGLMKQDSM